MDTCKKNAIKSEEPANYHTGAPKRLADWTDDDIIKAAKKIIRFRHSVRGEPLTSPKETIKHLSEHLQILQHGEKYESFGVMLMNTRHHVLAVEELFTGSVDIAHVHPRVIVERVLQTGAAAVIVWHNHPSGVPEPSQADIAITRKIRNALDLLDVRLLDHIIAADGGTVSLATRGMV